MTPTQTKDHLIPKFKAEMSAIGLDCPRDYHLSDDGKKWGFMYLRNCSDKQYEQAYDLLALVLNS